MVKPWGRIAGPNAVNNVIVLRDTMKLVATEKACCASGPQGGKRSVFSIIQHSWETGVKKGASDKGRSKKGFLVSSAARPRGHSPPELALEIAFHSHLVQPFGHQPQPNIAHRGCIFSGPVRLRHVLSPGMEKENWIEITNAKQSCGSILIC